MHKSRCWLPGRIHRSVMRTGKTARERCLETLRLRGTLSRRPQGSQLFGHGIRQEIAEDSAVARRFLDPEYLPRAPVCPLNGSIGLDNH